LGFSTEKADFLPRTDHRSTGVNGRSTDTRPWAPGFLPVDWLVNRSTAYSKMCTFVHIGRLPPWAGRPEFWN